MRRPRAPGANHTQRRTRKQSQSSAWEHAQTPLDFVATSLHWLEAQHIRKPQPHQRATDRNKREVLGSIPPGVPPRAIGASMLELRGQSSASLVEFGRCLPHLAKLNSRQLGHIWAQSVAKFGETNVSPTWSTSGRIGQTRAKARANRPHMSNT